MSHTTFAPRLRRIVAAASLILVVGAGLGIHLLLPDTHATDIAGDALYAAAAYAFVVVLAPRARILLVAWIAAAWCVGVELFQLTGIPLVLGGAFAPAMLVLGTVFDARDLVVYVATVVVVAAADMTITSFVAGRSAHAPARNPSREGGAGSPIERRIET